MKKDKKDKKHSKEEKRERRKYKESVEFSCCDINESCGCYCDPCGNYYVSACCC